MAREIMINGKRYRNYINGRIWVSDDGTTAYQSVKGQYNNYKPGKILKFKYDQNGEKYVINDLRKFIYIKKAVYVCFCPPQPNTSIDYEIMYKDGDKENLHYLNLEIKEKRTVHTLDECYKLPNELTITKSGKVFYKEKELTVVDYIYDSDIDSLVWVHPFIYAPSNSNKRIKIEDLMDSAGYIDGNRYSLKNPVILHKDHNPVNNASSNLEWVEKTDQRYIDYMKKVEEYKLQRNVNFDIQNKRNHKL